MKRILIIGALAALAACTEAPQSVGLGDGAGYLTGGARVNSAEAIYQKRVAAIQPVVTPSRPASATAPGAAPAALTNVRPRILERIKNAPPLNVYSGNVANVSASAITARSVRAMQSLAPRITAFRTPGRQLHQAGLVGGGMYRARLNGRDFAVLESVGLQPDLSATDFRLMAYRAGCTWDGEAGQDQGSYSHHSIVTVIGLSCNS